MGDIQRASVQCEVRSCRLRVCTCVEALSLARRGYSPEDVRRPEDKQEISFFGGVNPLSTWMSRKLRRRRKIW